MRGDIIPERPISRNFTPRTEIAPKLQHILFQSVNDILLNDEDCVHLLDELLQMGKFYLKIYQSVIIHGPEFNTAALTLKGYLLE